MAASYAFERPAHQRVASVLLALDGALLNDHHAVFGGGTRISLELDEFRCSRDVDFLVSDRKGYAALRALLRSEGLSRLFIDEVDLPREPRIDQYGIRFPVRVDDELLKVEIIAEGRIMLDKGEARPGAELRWASHLDCFAEKLLANSDRGFDTSVLSRDLIDLAALRMHLGSIPDAAWRKANDAYGSSVARDLVKLARQFMDDTAHRNKCFERLDVSSRDAIAQGVALLESEGKALTSP